MSSWLSAWTKQGQSRLFPGCTDTGFAKLEQSVTMFLTIYRGPVTGRVKPTRKGRQTVVREGRTDGRVAAVELLVAASERAVHRFCALPK